MNLRLFLKKIAVSYSSRQRKSQEFRKSYPNENLYPYTKVYIFIFRGSSREKIVIITNLLNYLTLCSITLFPVFFFPQESMTNFRVPEENPFYRRNAEKRNPTR